MKLKYFGVYDRNISANGIYTSHNSFFKHTVISFGVSGIKMDDKKKHFC
jgi:hypothetical protein